MARKNEKIIGGYVDKKAHATFLENLKSDRITASDFIRVAVDLYNKGELKIKRTTMVFVEQSDEDITPAVLN